jgi:hypothetical protein
MPGEAVSGYGNVYIVSNEEWQRGLRTVSAPECQRLFEVALWAAPETIVAVNREHIVKRTREKPELYNGLLHEHLLDAAGPYYALVGLAVSDPMECVVVRNVLAPREANGWTT